MLIRVSTSASAREGPSIVVDVVASPRSEQGFCNSAIATVRRAEGRGPWVRWLGMSLASPGTELNADAAVTLRYHSIDPMFLLNGTQRPSLRLEPSTSNWRGWGRRGARRWIK